MDMNVNELTRQLIDIPSVTGDEKAVGEFLHSHLAKLGFVVQRQEVAADRFNVIATTGVTPSVVLSTHMDTVPPWIRYHDDAERIYGRGACDAKGIIAAQIMAAERLRAEGIQSVGLLFTVDEEQRSLGAEYANIFEHDRPPDYLINGEPTDNKLAIATKGALRLTLNAFGRAAHSAYPEQGESAIEMLLDALQRVRQCEWPTDELLGDTTCNIGVIKGGTRPNVIPDEAMAELQLRLVSSVDPVKDIVMDAVGNQVGISFQTGHEPVFLEKLDGFEQCIVNFTTDIPYLPRWGKPLLLGPGSILNAHTEHEFVEKRELAAAVDIYARLVRTLLAKKSQAAENVAGVVK